LIPVQLSSKDIAPWGIHNEKTSDTWSDPIHGTRYIPVISAMSSRVIDHGAWSTLLPTSIALHGFLVVLFVALLGLGILRTEHSVIISLEHQQSVSFWCTIVATVFGTVCSDSTPFHELSHGFLTRSITPCLSTWPRNLR
jgi:magnesium-transporting ATPase (P-type)